MGYETNFRLSVVDGIITDEVFAYMKKSEYGTSWYRERDNARLLLDNERWYDNHHDMIALSEAFPDLVFFLTGHGEEYDDRWATYYNNGMFHVAEIVLSYAPFNKHALTKPVRLEL